jgi:site-specific recombinase XerD
MLLYARAIGTLWHYQSPKLYLGRQTFATTVTLSNGVPIESVSAMLGHKRISTMEIPPHLTTEFLLKLITPKIRWLS